MVTRKKMLVGGTFALAIILVIPIVGPFTFYPTLVPMLSPILPKREGVPNYASGSHSWKGFGLFWSWEKRYSSGCIKWGAAHNDDFVSTKLRPCDSARQSPPTTLSHWSYSDEVVFDRGDDWYGGDPCPFNVSAEEAALFSRMVRDAKTNATPEIEFRALERIESRLNTLDGTRLVTHHTGGCADYRQ